jgi:hypothetical protein
VRDWWVQASKSRQHLQPLSAHKGRFFHLRSRQDLNPNGHRSIASFLRVRTISSLQCQSSRVLECATHGLVSANSGQPGTSDDHVRRKREARECVYIDSWQVASSGVTFWTLKWYVISLNTRCDCYNIMPSSFSTAQTHRRWCSFFYSLSEAFVLERRQKQRGVESYTPLAPSLTARRPLVCAFRR